MRSAFAKDITRSIRGSLGRFLAIMGIVALGCGFYAGLQMCGPDMRADADALYDGTSLWDLRLISTLGFSDDDVARVAEVEGVERVMPSLTCDAMARLGTEQVAVRVSSLDVDAAEGSSPEGQYEIVSDDDAYLNRPRLVDGRWPREAGECVVSADVVRDDYGIGDEVTLLYGSTELEDLLGVDVLTIVGTVSASDYPYTGSFGSTNLGSGMIDQYLYVAPSSLAEDAPYTEIYLTVAGAVDELSESDEYLAVVDATKARIEDLSDELSAARQEDLKTEAQEKLDEKWDEYHEEKEKADKELADARKKLRDAKREILDGAKELEEGEAKYRDGLAEYESERAKTYKQLDDAEAEIERNQKKLDASRAELKKGAAELAAGKRAYEQGLKKLLKQLGAKDLGSARTSLENNAKDVADGITKLEEGIAQIEGAPAQAQAGIDAANKAIAQCEAGIAQADEAIAQCEAGMAQADAAIEQCEAGMAQADAAIAEAQAGVEEAQAAVDRLTALRDQIMGTLEQLRALGDAAPADRIAELEERLVQTESGLAQAQAGKDAADAGLAQAQAGKAEAEAGLAQAQAAKAEAEAGLKQATDAKAQATDGLAQAKEGLAQATQGLAEAEAAQAQLPGLRAQLKELQKTQKDVEKGLASVAQLEAAKKQLDDSQKQLDAGRAKINSGQAQIDEGRRKLAEGRATADAELAKAKAQLDDAAAELEDARAKLEDGRKEYRKGWRDYKKGKAEADEKFGDALTQLEDAQKEIDEIELPDIYALDRTQSEGAATYHADAGRIDSIADVFPFVFFLVAALVALTTMTRMVEDDRVLIGTYKALGYGTTAIAAKYLAYAGIAGVVGATVGILVLSQVLPYIVMSSYGIIYTVPMHELPLPIDLGIALMSGGIGVGVTLLATWGAVVSSLREAPATLMLPRAPKAGKRILLERVTPIWRRLSFTWKVTCRNLFRYKRRFLMTVIGISGCAALLLVGFGLHDSIWDIIDRQYGPIIHFDTTVGLDDDAIELDVCRVIEYLESTGEVSGIVRVQNENMRAGTADDEETIRVNVVVPRDAKQMSQAITFRNRQSGEELTLDDDAVLITEKLAIKYGLDVGDTIVLFDQDDVGNAVGDGHDLEVTGVAENYVGNLVYLGRDAWATVDGGAPVFSTIYASTTADEAIRKDITSDLHDMRDVSTVIFSDETINMYREMLSVVDLIVVVLIVSAAALAYIVLYNLTNINIGERIREIASLKVLGFTRGEVYTYIFREIALLALIGDVLGMFFGIFLERFVVVTAEVDYVMFGRSIHPPSFGYAFALTLVFAALVILSMRHKLDRVDMVESLKSVD